MEIVVNMTSPMPNSKYGVKVIDGIVTLSSPFVTYRVIGSTSVNKLVIAGAVSVVLDNAVITTATANAPISIVTGNVDIRFAGNNRLVSLGASAALGKAGLEILEYGSLTIREDFLVPGSALTAVGGYGSAGIGGSLNARGGNLTIMSGHITAIGYSTTAAGHVSGAGIGAGASTGAAGSFFGSITINGGTIKASGGSVRSNGGAGIGSGHADAGSSYVAMITINGGDISAKGGDFSDRYSGAGIGSACAGANAISRVGSIEINGSNTKVTATGGSMVGSTGSFGGAGIGSSWPAATGGESSVGDIAISDGCVNAIGAAVASFTGSGIGAAGTSMAAVSKVGSIVIHAGRITAAGGSCTEPDSQGGAGIGSGYAAGGGISTAGSIVIFGGEVTATASQTLQGGAGIGAGSAQGSNATTQVQHIIISGGNVTAKGSPIGAGIGTGGIHSPAIRNVWAKTGRIEISGGSVTAAGYRNSPGIGPGTASSNSTCAVANIRITGGTVTAGGSSFDNGSMGGAGIGTGFGNGGTSQVGSIEISGGAVIADASSEFSGAGIGAGGAACGSAGGARGMSIVGHIRISSAVIKRAAGGSHPLTDSGVGIGAASALHGAYSRVHEIVIENSTLEKIYGSSGGAAIGTGRADSDCSQASVGSISITGTAFGEVIGGNFGAGIGSGSSTGGRAASVIGTYRGTGLAADWKNWELGDILISDSFFAEIAAYPYTDAVGYILAGTGIGSGAAGAGSTASRPGGITWIGNIRMENVEIASVEGGKLAPGIGSGCSTNGGESRVHAIVLRNTRIEYTKGGKCWTGAGFEYDRGAGIGAGYANDFGFEEPFIQYSYGGTSTVGVIRMENTRIGGAYGGLRAPGIGAGCTENANPANAGMIAAVSHIHTICILHHSKVTAFAGADANGIGISEVAYSQRTSKNAANPLMKGTSHVEELQIESTALVAAYAVNFPAIWTGLPASMLGEAPPPAGRVYKDDAFNRRNRLWTGLTSGEQAMTAEQWLAIGGWSNKASTPAIVVNATFYKGRDMDGKHGINRFDASKPLVLASDSPGGETSVMIPPPFCYFAFTSGDPESGLRLPAELAGTAGGTDFRLKVYDIWRKKTEERLQEYKPQINQQASEEVIPAITAIPAIPATTAQIAHSATAVRQAAVPKPATGNRSNPGGNSSRKSRRRETGTRHTGSHKTSGSKSNGRRLPKSRTVHRALADSRSLGVSGGRLRTARHGAPALFQRKPGPAANQAASPSV
ncbi:hypothetical protein KP806_24150 [Paenibacillus sp. N4]|uniref:hypothetical protein n=1 Tax=Paenibacillus vietnamensis TaxID=2590547 RepID=UPI001CD05DA1|nr:hypothetical protein [Paenibacillus vietnamensis]MCA0758154.1 hypothetical protein [Paenibacillus vietnamensis]